jgi:hypothetical protein
VKPREMMHPRETRNRLSPKPGEASEARWLKDKTLY